MGNLDHLEAVLDRISATTGTVGIAHTRWATHGRPSNENAHPHTDCTGRFAIVLNGIVENYLSLRAELQDEGHDLHLRDRRRGGRPPHRAGLRRARCGRPWSHAYRQMEGHFTYCAVAVDEPDVIVAVRKETPLVVGLGEGENFLASAIPAFLAETRSVIFPEDGEIVVVKPDGVEICRLWTARRSTGRSQEVDWDEEAAEKAGYETFMLKEIHEQPIALADTLVERIGPDGRGGAGRSGPDAETHPGHASR